MNNSIVDITVLVGSDEVDSLFRPIIKLCSVFWYSGTSLLHERVSNSVEESTHKGK